MSRIFEATSPRNVTLLFKDNHEDDDEDDDHDDAVQRHLKES